MLQQDHHNFKHIPFILLDAGFKQLVHYMFLWYPNSTWVAWMPQTQYSKPIQLTCDDRWRALLVQKIWILNPLPQLENKSEYQSQSLEDWYLDGLLWRIADWIPARPKTIWSGFQSRQFLDRRTKIDGLNSWIKLRYWIPECSREKKKPLQCRMDSHPVEC